MAIKKALKIYGQYKRKKLIIKCKNDIYDLAFEVEMNTGIEISPVIKNEEQYEYWVDTLPFYRNVRDEGVVVSE